MPPPDTVFTQSRHTAMGGVLRHRTLASLTEVKGGLVSRQAVHPAGSGRQAKKQDCVSRSSLGARAGVRQFY